MISWYALHVHSQTEALVSDALAGQIETFWPHRVAHDNRKRFFRRPWFPGYVFARFDFSERLPVLTVPWVVRILGPTPQEATAIPDGEIESLQILVKSKRPMMQHPMLELGETVRVTRGPLKGAEGKVVRFKNTQLLVVAIELLGRAVATELDPEVIEAVARRDLPCPASSSIAA